MTTFEKVQTLLIERFDKKAEEIKLETSLKDDMNVDSLDFVEIMMEIEEEFNIIIDDEQAAGIKTLKELVDYIDSKI